MSMNIFCVIYEVKRDLADLSLTESVQPIKINIYNDYKKLDNGVEMFSKFGGCRTWISKEGYMGLMGVETIDKTDCGWYMIEECEDYKSPTYYTIMINLNIWKISDFVNSDLYLEYFRTVGAKECIGGLNRLYREFKLGQLI